MVKTLKITSIIAAVSAAIFVVLLGVFALRGDPEIEKLLNSPGAVELFKKQADTAQTGETDKVPALVQQARKFALKINPPPPPEPPKPPAGTKKPGKEPPEPPRPPTVSAKFKLLATCRYELDPGRSLALLDMPTGEDKWFRQGDKVGHLLLKEIKDGKIIYADGSRTSEMSMPKKPIKSLLKSDATIPYVPSSSTSPSRLPLRPAPEPKTPEDAIKALIQPDASPAIKTRSRTKPPAQPTHQQRIKILDGNISEIQKIMQKSASEPGAPESEKDREKQEWAEIIKMLEKEKEQIEEEENTTNADKNTPKK